MIFISDIKYLPFLAKSLNRCVSVVVLSILGASSAQAQIETTNRAPAPKFETVSEGSETVETLGTVEEKARAAQSQSNRIRAGGLVFASFDMDHDYLITDTEIKDGVRMAYKRADRDGNGRLTNLELEDWRIKALGSAQAKPGNVLFDTDIDGTITLDEFTQQMLYLAKAHDKDKNGVLKFSELLTVNEPEPLFIEAKPVRQRRSIDVPDPLERRRQERRQNRRR